ncbi:MAG: WecB/TagA/CpsF family glycosyltransferase [Candidatus Margulisiibacteriota bacterium]
MIVTLLGYPLQSLTYEAMVATIRGWLAEPGFHSISTLNPEIVVLAEQVPEVKAYIQTQAFCVADGNGLRKAAQWKTGTMPLRITGMDLSTRLLEESGLSFYFLGAQPEVLEKAVAAVTQTYPQAHVVGAQHGYFQDDAWPAIQDDIQRKQPDIILVALGFPRQEIIIQRLAKVLPKGVAMGVGGVFDVLSGEKKRAPAWVQWLNIEWVYRGLIDPKRMKRWGFIPRFLWRCFWAK